MHYTEITNEEQWREVCDETTNKPAILFKHSTRCPISAGAFDELQAYWEDAPNEAYDYYMIDVLRARSVSNLIAEELGVQHESPQLICVEGKQAKWHASHWTITYSYLIDNLNGGRAD